MNSKKTISQVFEEFLSDQETRLSPKALSKYERVRRKKRPEICLTPRRCWTCWRNTWMFTPQTPTEMNWKTIFRSRESSSASSGWNHLPRATK